MIRGISLAIVSLIIFTATIVNAKELPTEADFEMREIQLICAMSSLAAYSGDESFLVRSSLDSRGWKIDAITNAKNGVTVKAYTVSKKFFDGRIVKILVVAGTEDLKDVEVDFRLGGVTLHKDDTSKSFVHKGFRDYADATLDGGVAENLVAELKNNSKETLYLTGHSLGGSIAIVMATRLNDMGVDKNQLKVITFGALAVGNKALTEAYNSKIDLTRIEIKGDVVKKMFKPFGYVQFGNLVTWKPAKNVDHHEHKISMYLDCAIRNYFDAEGFSFGDEDNGENKIEVPVYVAPIKFVKKNFSAKDEKYIYGVLRTGLSARLGKLTFDEKNYIEVKSADEISDNLSPIIAAAKNSGCKYILVQLVNADRVREATDNERQVMLYEFLCDLNGMPVIMQTSGMSTKDLTLIEAVSFAQENLSKKLDDAILAGN